MSVAPGTSIVVKPCLSSRNPWNLAVDIDVVADDLTAGVDADALGRPPRVRVIERADIPASLPDVAVLDEVVGAGEPAVIVDVEDACASDGVGSIDGGEAPFVQQKSMALHRGIAGVLAHDLAAVVDGAGRGPLGVRDVDRGEAPLGIPQEASDRSGAIGAAGGRDAHDAAAVVDIDGNGGPASRSVDRGEDAVGQQEPVGSPFGIDILPDDLAKVVDAERLGPHGAGDIDFGEDSFVEQESAGSSSAGRLGSSGLYAPTICPCALILETNVAAAPGKSITVNASLSFKKPCSLPRSST